MQDLPAPAELLNAVARLMREELMPALSGRNAFLARVAANAVDLARRQFELEAASNAAEQARLKALLGRDGALEDLNRALCEAIENGAMSKDTPALAHHLWATTLEKLAVDQPSYATYAKHARSRD